ncbi:MAG: ABC-F family ATP-binding cassette domain-containing protein [Armatimonadetes bacterium]|nr:ABC-F family ATP-binding cassette domain-containing protein [Armatimonadota bacterium]
MAFLLSCQEITKSYGARPLFQGITLGIDEGERMGLLGPNGSGKSTLLRLMAGEERPDSGILSGRRGLRLGYLPQEDLFAPGVRVDGVLAEALTGEPLDDGERERKIDAMLARMGFAQRDAPVETLSGGWKKRLALARELISEPDLLLLDEPTNHLDLDGIRWLEDLLRRAPFAFVLVSHDRYFLENVTRRIVELNRAYPEGYLSVVGAYSDFLLKKEEFLHAQSRQQQVLESRVRREVEWLRRGPQGRQTKSSARIQEAGRLMGDLDEVRFRNAQNRTAGLDFNASGRKTKELLVLKGVEKGRGGKVLFSGLDLTLSPGVRLGLVGPNGGGKTTLLQLLNGEIEPDRGTIRQAEGLQTVYFDQDREQLDLRMTLRNALAPEGDTVRYQGKSLHVVAWAKRFLFREEQLEMPLGQLSGGEQARVLIARLMLRPADLLLLDEPTNDLDIPTLEVLEESLLEFPGAVALVTHDRFLLDRVATEVLGIDGEGRAGFFADVHQWEAWRDRQASADAATERAVKKVAAVPPPPRVALTSSERREWNTIEGKIEAAEAEVQALQARMEDPEVASDHEKLGECWAELQHAQQREADLYARWELLEAKKKAAEGG